MANCATFLLRAVFAILSTSLRSMTINKFGSSDTQHMTSAINYVLTAQGWTTV